LDFVIVTGLSGAGKSTTIAAFEDMDFYCVDNMPIEFIPKFAEFCCQSGSKIQKVALVIDIRSGANFESLILQLEQLEKEVVNLKILFLNSQTDTIVRRFKETRRKHPLADKKKEPVKQLIEYERTILKPLFEKADYVIDTSYITAAQLKEQIGKLFREGKKSLNITVQSFGFKYGASIDSDMVFDVRCLPNPFYIEEIKHLSGLDAPIYEYVFSFEQTREYVHQICNMLSFLLPLFIEEGKTSLVIGIGCTGGRHRSVAIAQRVAQHFKEIGFDATAYHRDMEKNYK